MAKPDPEVTSKRCRSCDAVKPIGEFYAHAAYSDGFDNRCRTCINRAPKSDTLRLTTRIRSRANNRALARLKKLRKADFERLYAVALGEVLAETQQLGPDARLKTGPARKGETVTDRIRELCPDCGESHAAGHVCPHCGRKPTDPPVAEPRPAPQLAPSLVARAVRPTRRPPPVEDERAARQRRLDAANARIMAERNARQAELDRRAGGDPNRRAS